MTIDITEGCIAFSYQIDGKEFVDLTLKQQKDVLNQLIQKETDSATLQYWFREIIKSHPNMKYTCSKEPCECCGDYIEEWKLTI